MDRDVDSRLLEGVARPCPDCAEERLFVPAEPDSPGLAEFCCTWCGAALLIDPCCDDSQEAERSRRLAG